MHDCTTMQCLYSSGIRILTKLVLILPTRLTVFFESLATSVSPHVFQSRLDVWQRGHHQLQDGRRTSDLPCTSSASRANTVLIIRNIMPQVSERPMKQSHVDGACSFTPAVFSRPSGGQCRRLPSDHGNILRGSVGNPVRLNIPCEGITILLQQSASLRVDRVQSRSGVCYA